MDKLAEWQKQDFGQNNLDLARCKKILLQMKKLANKALEVFRKLSEEVNAVLINQGPYWPNFDEELYENQEVYLFDRKHGLEQLDTPSGYPNLGWAILQSSKKEEYSRFSYLAIHNKTKKIIDVYQVSMVQVKYWKEDKALEGYWAEVDKESYITSSLGLSGSL